MARNLSGHNASKPGPCPPRKISMLTLNAVRVSPRLVFQRAAPAARRAAPQTVRAMSGEPALDKSTPEEVRDGLGVVRAGGSCSGSGSALPPLEAPPRMLLDCTGPTSYRSGSSG